MGKETVSANVELKMLSGVRQYVFTPEGGGRNIYVSYNFPVQLIPEAQKDYVDRVMQLSSRGAVPGDELTHERLEEMVYGEDFAEIRKYAEEAQMFEGKVQLGNPEREVDPDEYLRTMRSECRRACALRIFRRDCKDDVAFSLVQETGFTGVEEVKIHQIAVDPAFPMVQDMYRVAVHDLLMNYERMNPRHPPAISVDVPRDHYAAVSLYQSFNFRNVLPASEQDPRTMTLTHIGRRGKRE